MQFPGSLLLVGAGKMGGALLDGWLARGAAAGQIGVRDPALSDDQRRALTERGVVLADDLAGVTNPAVIVLAVKPQIMDAVLPPLAPLVAPETLVLSIAAGRTIASLAAELAPGSKIVRAMPNTPAAIGRGMTVCVAGPGVSERNRQLANELLSAVGDVAWIANEADMDAVTAVSGSGPAYVFLLAEALAAAGRRAGLDAGLADRLAIATVAGSGELLGRSGHDAATLRQNVTSPGGTTAAALAVLMDSGDQAEGALERLIGDAVAAAAGRSRELAK